MRTIIKIAIATMTFAALPLAAISVVGGGGAYADSMQFEVGNVAIGYSDGYWDHQHQWHAWEKPEYRDRYRAERSAEYHDWRHDRDRDMGWHEPR